MNKKCSLKNKKRKLRRNKMKNKQYSFTDMLAIIGIMAVVIMAIAMTLNII